MEQLTTLLDEIFSDTLDRFILSNRRNKSTEFQKIIIRQKENKQNTFYQAEQYTTTQVIHRNLTLEEVKPYIISAISDSFKQFDAFTVHKSYTVKCKNVESIAVSRKNLSAPVTINLSHNREKSYLIKEGTIVPPLVDLGVITADGKIIKSRYDKFKQINRFIELIEDGIGNRYDTINIIDFGCGKSYLTFILYYYLTEVKKIKANIIGLDLKEQVIKDCNAISKQYGYDGLRFELGDINGYQANFPVHMVITLHACDTATDFALANAVAWNADMIYSVPCCQHEVNGMLHSETLPLLERYGILKERLSSVITDSIRGAMLEYSGYRTQVIEFIDMAHSPKNLLIRAVRGGISKQKSLEAKEQAEAVMKEFNLSPTIYQLLNKDK